MQKHVEYRNLSKWVKISSPPVYKKVLKQEEKGYLTSESVREGKMPEKAIYSITATGMEYFLELMKEHATDAVSVLFDFNAVVSNLNKLPKEQALELVADIRASIENNKAFMAEMVPQRQHIPLVGRTIIDQQIQIFDTLLAWVDAFTDEIRSNPVNRHYY